MNNESRIEKREISGKLVVYTVLLGDGFTLPNTIEAKNVDYVCFTDDLELEANGWRLKKVAPIFLDDIIRSSREAKVLPHKFLGEYSRSLYIDTRVQLTTDPNFLWGQLISNDEDIFGAFYHSFSDTVRHEFHSVEKLGLDDPVRLQEQKILYERHYPEILEQRPIWGGILARRHNHADCIRAMEAWYCYILRYSRRDQLSLPLALALLSHEKMNVVYGDNHKGEFFFWPTNTFKPDRYYQYSKSRIARSLLKLKKRCAVKLGKR